MVSKSLFQKFRNKIKELKGVTTEIFNSEAKKFVENEDASLKNALNDLPFKNIAKVVTNSTHKLGFIRQLMEQYLASYCNATISTDVSDLPEIDISIFVNDSTIPVSSSPTLTLKDLLSKVHYSFWDMIKIFFKKLFSGFKDTDPRRPLLEPEINAFLKELEEHFVKDCHEYFEKIKPGIVQSYLEEHRKTAEKHITDVEQQYSRQREAMDAQVREWRKQARFNRETVKSHSDLIDNLEKQKVHLLSLANQFGISLCPKQDY
ncbi:PREDICTED: uncharacterized protein LOC109584475 [Amphimedon queenslandica]|uniref:Uncharacterized protein n=2 Tax=Amphimedon queenslandica TaxID=400682 RepID=A0AAN0JFP6_AMPQE|nr:PREDICTED: uncharacterized protein LOC109584475 [Amphimedon queenslandica]|eukprot:XP_019855784.1 PREDICTED: uncharacterized protein LOC109584475 [Amphimedon queenslandica]